MRGVDAAGREEMIEDLLIQSLQRPPAPLPHPPPPPAWIEEERFLSSQAPSLHRLPPQQREFVKFQIHKLIYENTFVTLNWTFWSSWGGSLCWERARLVIFVL